MKRLLPLLAGAPALLAACATTDPGGEPADWVRYACSDGSAVEVRYPSPDRAELRRDGALIAMGIQRSASGARYAGGGWEWWTKGPGGTLAALQPGEDVASAPGLDCLAPSS